VRLTVIQVLPALESGGVERGTLEIASEIVQQGHRSIVVSRGGQLVDKLVAGGSEHVKLPVGDKSLSAFTCINKLSRLLVEENVSILHARSRLPAWISFFALNKIPENIRPKFVTTVHGQYSVNSYSKIMFRSDRIIAISNFINNYIHENYPDIDKNKITIIHRGVSEEEFPYGYSAPGSWLKNWYCQYPETMGKYLVTLPARITRIKGHEDFTKILVMAIKGGLPVHGLVVGGTSPDKLHYLNQIRKNIIDAGINNKVTFVGNRFDLREVMSISNVILSLTQIPEAFGRTVLEALSIGKPVIAYDHGGVSEIMHELYPPGCVTPFNKIGVFCKLKEFHVCSPSVNRHNPFTLESMQQKTLSLYCGLYN
jgi:glycosyltransferase involved in cell wall biosynthesis